MFQTIMAKILIVEDDAFTRKNLVDILQLEKYQVEAAGDGKEALALLETSDFDVVILDWELPGLTGPQICRELRRSKKECWVLMLTGHSDESDKEDGLDSGADDYVTKPFAVREVLARIRALLRRGRSQFVGELSHCGVTLDVNNKEVVIGEKRIQLKVKEYALLEYLMRNRGHTFSPDALIRSVWSSDEAVTHDAVRQTVKRIREKLENPEIIASVYGVGYRMD